MRKNLRNAVVLTSIAALALAGCAPDAGEPGTVTLSVLYEFSSDTQKAATEAVFEDFQSDNPEINLSLQPIEQAKLPDVLQTRIAGGDSPDVVLTVPTRVQNLMVNGQLLDLTDYLPDGYAEAFGENGLLAEEYEGKVYGFPLSRGIRAVAYNIDLFDQAGVDVPQVGDEPWTWDELVDAATTVKESTGIPYGLQFEKPSFDGWLSFLFQSGGGLFTDDLSEPATDSAASVRALSWTNDLHASGLAAPGVLEGVEDPLQIFASGRSALWLATGNFAVPGLQQQVVNFEYGFTYMPTDAKAATTTFGNDIVALSSTEHPDEAWTLVNYITSAETIARISNGMGNLPARADAEGVAIEREDFVPFFLDQATHVDPEMVRQMLTPAYAATRDALLRELQSMLGGQQTPQQAGEKMAGLLRDELGR